MQFPTSYEVLKNYIIQELDSYWPVGRQVIRKLPVKKGNWDQENFPLPPEMRLIELPKWASYSRIKGEILVPLHLINPGNESEWERVDWFGVAFWYLNGIAERAYEHRNGPIHSYSFKLKGWDSRLWNHAWVNHIARFLRCWSSHINNKKELALFGALPESNLKLTHDVDAVEKTIAIRFKQTTFNLINGVRDLLFRNPTLAKNRFSAAKRFLFNKTNYWHFDHILSLEQTYKIKSCFLFYAGKNRGYLSTLMNPSYNIEEPRLRKKFQSLDLKTILIGLHPSFETWQKSGPIERQKDRLERLIKRPVKLCRQHWLKFAWSSTWRAQQAAGFELDMTLGFNDRIGFRNSAALDFHPWDFTSGKPMGIRSLPMVLMDSHLFDYDSLNEDEQTQKIEKLLDELKITRGTGSAIWHQQVFNEDYGWETGYSNLLEMMKQKGIHSGF